MVFTGGKKNPFRSGIFHFTSRFSRGGLDTEQDAKSGLLLNPALQSGTTEIHRAVAKSIAFVFNKIVIALLMRPGLLAKEAILPASRSSSSFPIATVRILPA